MPTSSSVLWTETPLLEAGSPVVEIASKKLKARLDELMENKGRRFQLEFNQLNSASINASTQVANSQKGQSKNRYGNIVPFDYNRVKLGTDGTGPYINASHINSASGEYPEWAFIATQGPTMETVADFWQMVYEWRCQAIAEQVLTTSEYTITLLETNDVSMDITLKKLKVRHLSSMNSIEVTHYHYHEWPDHSVPQYTRPTRDLVNMLEKSEARTSRIVVHCSAGVGRTGAFCTIHVILRRLKALQDELALGRNGSQRSSVLQNRVECAMNIPLLVTAFRAKRNGMVQTMEQYYFCYQAVNQELDAVLSRQ